MTAAIQATTVVKFSDDLSTTPATYWGFSGAAGGTMTYVGASQLEQFRWSASNSATRSITTVTGGTDGKVTYEMIVKYYTTGTSVNSGNWYLLDAAGNAITGIAFFRSSSQWRIGRATTYTGPGTPTVAPTIQDYLAADQPIAKITIVLDFTAKTLTYKAQQGTWDATNKVWTDGATSVTATTNLGFINAAATDLTTFYMNYWRKSTTTGTIGFDLYKVSVSRDEVASTASVTVKFKDQDGNYFKTDEVATEQVVANPYNATLVQKSSVIIGGNYYVLNPSSAISVASVDAAGSTLELLFRRQTNTTDLTWNGTADTNGNLWSQWYQNFTNSAVAYGYQNGSNVTFGATAANTAVTVTDAISMGTGNMNITAPNYAITGAGTISGTGSMNINLGASDALTLGVTNNLSGTTQIAGGQITVTKAGALANSAVVNSTTTLLPSVALPAITFNASSSILPSAASSIAGITASTGTKVSVTSATNTVNALSAFLITPAGTFTGELELNGTATTETRFGLTAANATYLGSAKLALKGNALMYVDANHTATTINVGSLTGEAGTKLGWGRSSATDRAITWSVGSLGESTEFAGIITNVGGYNASGSFWSGLQTNFIKTGAGTLTMSGISNKHNGSFIVNGGELKVTGAICDTTATGAAVDTVLVGASAKLSGTGLIGGNTRVFGTLDGRLSFASNLTLSPTSVVNLVVNGFATSEFDSIKVVGAAIYDGTLNITVSAPLPAYGTTVKVLHVGSYTGTFLTVNVPAGYKFDETSGTLSYGFYTKLGDVNSKLSVYPTLTNGIVHIQGGNAVSAEVVNLAGQAVKTANLTSSTTINLSDLSIGAYLVKVRSIDGSVSVQKVVLQK